MKITAKQLLYQARRQHFAVPATNFIDLDSARTFVATAEARGLPLILAYAQSHRHILSLEEAAAIGNLMADQVSVPVVLHLDHGEDINFISQAIELGFSSVMIDASMDSFEVNIAKTKEVVALAHAHGVSVEAELGHVGANDISEASQVTDSIYTEVDDVIEFIQQTGVDSLAVSIGTAHGLYKGEPKLNFERLQEIYAMTEIPLVLHGGSSTGDENLKRCARQGISKINIYSDFIHAAYQAIQTQVPQDYIALKSVANQAMAQVLNHYYDVFETLALKEEFDVQA
ncbi:class II fructose-bisphosphate aldolase [Ignavigranum ruoffiae]|uniref:class II fructose-bisphosphate aldolase n=1 Tax=Ignavigranum ruoffiae TaxID=89093 RepID=UPI0024AE466C|nr:class II fructose-bisphosphate aldolase [Ignavigranum ruoffiae]